MPVQLPAQLPGESQDSQAILEALRAELGVESVASSPAVAATVVGQKSSNANQTETAQLPRGGIGIDGVPMKEPVEGAPEVPGRRTRPFVSQGRDAKYVTRQAAIRDEDNEHHDRTIVTEQALPTEISTAMADEVEPNYGGGDDSLPDTLPETLPQDNTAYAPEDPLREAGGPMSAPAPPRDISQQTPTQPNEGRSYDEACTRVLSSMPNLDTQQSNFEAHTLHEDDTGAVNFGSLTQYPRQSSPVSEDVGFENARGGWRIPDDTQQNSLHSHTPYKTGEAAPETPALPKNPFGAAAGGPAPFGGTQLFGQTQLLTSAVKNSPTSSRPSPNVFYNPVSPNMMETSPLKNRANVSSPTDVRTSSPQRLHEVPATVIKGPKMEAIAEETPSIRRSMKEETIPESPTYQRPRSSGQQPLAHYEPMKQSQARKAADEPPSLALGNDSDSDDTVQRLERRKRIERKRAQAAQEMVKIKFPSLSHNESENQHAAKRRRTGAQPAYSTAPMEDTSMERTSTEKNPSSRHAPKKTQLSSLEPPSLESTKATPGDEEGEENEHPAPSENDAGHPVASAPDDEMIPATSPVGPASGRSDEVASPRSEPDLPTLPREQSRENSVPGDAESSSLPPRNSRRAQKYGRRTRSLHATAVISSSASASTPEIRTANENLPHATAPELSLGQSKGSALREATPVTTRSRTKKSPQTPVLISELEAPTTASSSLTPLSRTPQPSSKTTPTTKDSSVHRPSEAEGAQSPSANRNLRKKTVVSEVATGSPRSNTRALRMSKRLLLEPQSSDPVPAALMHAPEATLIKHAGQTIEPVYRNDRHLFQGMTFAISLQAVQSKQLSRAKLEAKITAAGGIVLQDGFQELFQPSPATTTADSAVEKDSELVLSPAGAECGFTALIADCHSRKAKYMQALALGIPCLAPQWVMTCLNKGAIIDWQPYLLCAGASAVLGNAIRSRCLLPYRADEARLSEIVRQRYRLLQGQSILLVVDPKKAKNQAKQPYLFLTQALGPSITRVSTVEQARELLHTRSGDTSSFDWLYIDKATATTDAVLSPPTRSSKKRKKTPPSPALSIRVLHDELIIQSLILSRIVEVDEEIF